MHQVKLLIIGLLLSVTTTIAFGQGKGTVRGVVYDRESGETVMFASVYIQGTTLGTTTNHNDKKSKENE